MPEPASSSSDAPLTALAALATAFSLAAALAAARTSDWTYDEPHHLEYSERLLDRRISERDSAERFNSKTPVSLLNVLARRTAFALGVGDGGSLLFASRLPTVAALLATIAATWLGARWLLGARAAALAATCVALDPSLIAHGSLITVDVYYAFAHLLTLLCAVAARRRPTLPRALALGAALGLALAAKFTGLLLIGGLAFLPLIPKERGAPRARPALGVAAGLATLLVLWTAYLGSDTLRPLGGLAFRSTPFRAVAESLPGLALPVPAAFLSGVDQTLATDRSYRPIVAFGNQYSGGTAFYFVGLWLVKTPVLLMLAQLAGLVAAARAPALRSMPELRFLAWNLVLVLAFFSLFFRTQVGYRYVLACIPLAWILAGAGLARSSPRAARAFAIAAVVAAIEVAGYWGNPLSFTNELVWPKRDAYRLMADSNLDWGQNHVRIRAELAARGIPPERLDPLHLLAGVNVIPVNVLAGVVDFERHRFVREHLAPREHIGHTHLVYEASREAFDAFLNARRRVAPDEGALAICGVDDAVVRATLTPEGPLNGSLPFRRSSNPQLVRNWLVCLDASDGADVSFDLFEGRAQFGRYASGTCRNEWLAPGQQSWYRLLPGRHVLCVQPVPAADGARPSLVHGAFTLHSGAAVVEIRRSRR